MSLTQSFDPYKSQWSSPEAGDEDNIPDVSSKRRRVNENTRKARHAARAKYWDTLSKVWLTPRALREFDRRNALQSREQKCTTILELWPQGSSSVAISQLSAASLKDLKLFARRGGPNLKDLRNVSQANEPMRLRNA